MSIAVELVEQQTDETDEGGGLASYDRFEFMSVRSLKEECRRLEGLNDVTCFYEVVNGESRCSDPSTFIRVYVWANSYDEAMLMAKRSFQENGCKRWDFGYLGIRRLFRKCDGQFVTKPSDSGFGSKWKLEII